MFSPYIYKLCCSFEFYYPGWVTLFVVTWIHNVPGYNLLISRRTVSISAFVEQQAMTSSYDHLLKLKKCVNSQSAILKLLSMLAGYYLIPWYHQNTYRIKIFTGTMHQSCYLNEVIILCFWYNYGLATARSVPTPLHCNNTVPWFKRIECFDW